MESSSVQVRQSSTGLLYSFSMSIIVVIVSYRIGASLKLFDTFWGWGLGSLLFFCIAASVPVLFQACSWVCVLAMLGAIPFGVAADATYDFFVNHIDRNLFPFEIVFWWVVTPVPLLLGYGTGRLRHGRRT
jgi:hypothetical protein